VPGRGQSILGSHIIDGVDDGDVGISVGICDTDGVAEGEAEGDGIGGPGPPL